MGKIGGIYKPDMSECRGGLHKPDRSDCRGGIDNGILFYN